MTLKKKIDIHFILIVIEYIFNTHLAIDIVLTALISVLARVTCRSEHLPQNVLAGMIAQTLPVSLTKREIDM